MRNVLFAGLLAIGMSAAASAQSDSLNTRLQAAVQRYERGDRVGANEEFSRFIQIYNANADRLTSRELVAVAIACSYLGRQNPQMFRDALRAFDRAVAKDPENLDARVRLAELFLEKYSSADAKRTLAAVLSRDSAYVPALVAEARRRAFDGERGADALLDQALLLRPEDVAARILRARFLADAEGFAAATREVDRALKADPADAEALAFGAALRRVSGDANGYADLARRYDALYPKEAGVQVALAELLSRVRQYAAAAEAAREGTVRDPGNWRAHALLGVNQLRLGEIAGAKKSLEAAFAGDPFDIWTKNTLDLLDTFKDYDELTTPRFRFVIEKAESGVLAPYLSELAERAFATFSTKYGFTPATPIRVEVYRSHADFSVRTVGLAGLGALGVSFGTVLVMDAPSARDPGSFNWGSTAWHELAHTFTLGLSAHRVPRWFSEGLSVLEERRARPGWGADPAPEFLAAFKAGGLLPVSRLNDGFVRPSHPAELGFSYYQASLLCEMIEARWGRPALVKMLQAYRDGQDTPGVFASVLQTTPNALAEQFSTWFRQRFATTLASIAPWTGNGPATGAFASTLAEAHSLLEQKRAAEAKAAFERAEAMFPDYAGPDAPSLGLARLARDRGDKAAAVAALARHTALDESAFSANALEASLREELGDVKGAAAALERILWIAPYDPALHARLADLADRLDDRARALRERRAVVRLAPSDLLEARYQLARALARAGDPAAARREILQVLEAAPGFEKAQGLLLELRKQPQGGMP